MSGSTGKTPSGEFTPVVTGFDVGAAPAGHSVSEIQIGLQNTAITPYLGELEENELDDMPKSIINRLIALKHLQEESDKIEQEYKIERVALEKKYRELKAPQWEKRQQVVNGEVEVEALVKEDVVVEEDEKIVGIPNFWAQCLQNHPNISELITDDDATALTFLRDIKCEYNDDMSGFKLTFVFAQNPYFSNKELTKSYTVSPDLLDEKAPALTNVEGATIDWKDPSKNLCVAVERKKQRAKSGKRQGQVRYVTSTVDKESFFHYFKEPSMSPDEDEEDEDEEGEAKGSKEFNLSIDEDYEIGHAIRTAIIPEAVLWFTGEAAGDDEDLDDDEEDDEDDYEDEDEDDDEDDPDEESEEVSKPTKGKKGWKGAGGPAAPATASGEQPECKQN